MAQRIDLPSGTVTFLFSDVEGSTALLHRLGEKGYAEALAEHRRVIRAAAARHGGVEVDTQGDAFFIAFPTAPGALAAASEMVEGLSESAIRVRIGLHSGTPLVTSEGYVGNDVHRAARIAAAGHGGQVLVSAATAGLLYDSPLKDLGEHRLKDLSAPERIHQLGEEEFPALKTLYRTNLPIPATPFIGRELDVRSAARLVLDDAVRLLTFAGPGGTGKTRLALQVAGHVADFFEGGLFWVPLAPLSSPSLVASAIAAAVGATGSAAAAIADRPVLLLLDNFEHVVAAAPEVSTLLAACPNLKVLVTSRELLRVGGEQVFDTPPLPRHDARRLFTARARAIDPGFAPDEHVDTLCARLDDLPLAIELAAARVRILPPRKLVDRLGTALDALRGGRDADPRQQTLRATIEWSHDLLEATERQHFANHAVFSDGWTVETAEAIVDADLGTLEALVDKSLVKVRDGERFWMLETIREFAEERLDARPDAAELRARHARWFCTAAAAIEDALYAGDPKAHRWVTDERSNLRRAYATFDAQGDSDSQIAMLAPLFTWGDLAELDTLLARALARDSLSEKRRVQGMRAAARTALERGRVEEGRRRAEEAIGAAQALGEPVALADAQFTCAFAYFSSGESDRAYELADAAVAGFDASGCAHRAIWAARLRATSAQDSDVELARRLHEANLERATALGNRRAEATIMGALALLATPERLADARDLLSRNLPIFLELGEEGTILANLCRIGVVLAHTRGSEEVAARLLGYAMPELTKRGSRPRWIEDIVAEGRARIADALGDEECEAAHAAGAALARDEVVELAGVSLLR